MIIQKILYKLELKMLGIKIVKKPEGVQEYDGYSLPDKKLSKLEKFIVKKLHKINRKYRQKVRRTLRKGNVNMTQIEKAYEDWKSHGEKAIPIDGHTYYRIVFSEHFKLSTTEKEVLCVVLGPDMPSGRYFQDENGNHFTFGGFNHIRFIDEIPEWYYKCGICDFKWKETIEIGKYLRVIE